MAKGTLRLRPEDYDKIDEQVQLKDDEFYAVVTTPHRGRMVRSIHVFHRQPTEKELLAFENLSSKIEIRGNRTDFKGSPLEAFARLYNLLIVRAYDVPVGAKILGEGTPLDKSEAQKHVPTMMKRRALNDTVGTHLSESQAAEMEEETEGPLDPAEGILPALGDEEKRKVTRAGATADTEDL